MTDIAVGKYTIYFTKDGYQNLSQVIDLKDGKKETVSVTMSKTTVAQQPVPTGVVAGVSGSRGSSGSNGSNGTASNKQSSGMINGHEYVDLGLPSGTLWATCNVGASKPEYYGNYYAWGETTTKSNYNWNTYKWCRGSYDSQTKYNTKSSYGTVDNKKVLELSDDAARANWGGSWRMPTYDELVELKSNCTWTWTSQGGKNGYRVTGPNGKSIFLPAAGYYYEGSLYCAGSRGYYWSSSLSAGSPGDAYYLGFNSSGVYVNDYDRLCGQSVRPVCPQQN